MSAISVTHFKHSEPYRILLLAAIAVAADDAMGKALSGHPRRQQIMNEARSFFVDGRYELWMSALGLDHTVLPEGVAKCLIK